MNEKARQALRASFGVWRKRKDLAGDSETIVNALRAEWEARERRLGLTGPRPGRSEEVRDGEKADGTD